MFEKNTDKTNVIHMVAPTTTHPTIYINYTALAKMKQYVDNCSKEIGWLGKSIKNEDGSYTIEDVYLIQQEVTGVTTELDENAMMEFFQQIRSEKGIEEVQKIRVWGHSHVDMAVFASSQDNETFEEYYRDCNYFIRIIANKKSKMKIDLADKEAGLIYNNLPWFVKYPDTIEALIKEYDEVEAHLKMIEKTINEELSAITPDETEIKAEIKTKVVEYKHNTNVTSFRTKNGNVIEDYEDYYGSYYGWGYEDEDTPEAKLTTDYDEQELAYYDYLFKSLDKGTLPFSTAPNVISYKKVTEMLDPYEIEQIVNLGEKSAVKLVLKDDKRFTKYSNKDWDRLVAKCEELYLAVLDADTAS